MHTDLKLLLIMAMSTMVFCGCMQERCYEAIPEISVSEESVTVEAAVRDGYISIVDTLIVCSNRSWGLNIVDAQGDAVDWVTVSVEDNMNLSGMQEKTYVILTFDPNWVTSVRQANLVITSAECEKIVPVLQRGASHNLAIDKDSTVTSFGPRDRLTRIYFKTNTNWSASVAEGETIRDVVLSKSSGNDKDTYIDVTFGPPYSVGKKHACVVFDVEGMDHQITVDLVQTGLVLELGFDEQPFTTDLPESSKEIVSTDYVYQWYGSDYIFQIGKNEIQYRGADKCLLLKNSKTFIKLPAVESLRLSEVQLKSVATDKKFTISPDGTSAAVDGGNQKILAFGAIGVWELSDTQVGMPYFVYSGSGSARIAELRLIYE